MKKQSSSRSQRGSRGIKGKHVVQICVLLGVCIWLIYQVKYSHDKKKEFYEADVKKSTVLLESEEGMVKLGRKDLLPGYHKKTEKEKHVEEEEDDEEEEIEKESKSKAENSSTHEEEEKEDEDEVAEDEEDKNKLGEEVVEEDEEENKHEEEGDIDEQDQSKDDELLQEEKENGSNEKETETNHADEIDMTVHEAREEHYKADDASSAVSHESRILNIESLKESFGNSTRPAQENSSNATIPVLKLGEAVEKATTEVKEGDSESSNSESAVTELRGETVNGNSTEAVLEASGFSQNETRTMQERSQEHDRTEDAAPPPGSSDLQTLVQLEQTRNETDANITVSANNTNTSSIQDESRNSTSKSSLIENISGSNGTEVQESSRYEGDDETEEKESSDHFATEQTEEADDTPESTMLQEEREALTDPQTLPDISIEGKEEEDEEEAMAAE